MADFNSVESTIQITGTTDSDLSQVKVRVWAEKGLETERVLEVASQSLKFYSNIFKTSINLEKLDLLVLPKQHDFIEIKDDNYYGLIYLE